MSSGAFAHPFKIDPRGQVATVPYGSSDEVEGIIRALIDTRPGDRPIFDEFGTPDPTFFGVDVGDIQAGLDQFGPEGVHVESIETEIIGQNTQRASIKWAWDEEETDEEITQ